MTKLDYTLDSPQERLEVVNKILEENPSPDPGYLEILADKKNLEAAEKRLKS